MMQLVSIRCALVDCAFSALPCPVQLIGLGRKVADVFFDVVEPFRDEGDDEVRDLMGEVWRRVSSHTSIIIN